MGNESETAVQDNTTAANEQTPQNAEGGGGVEESFLGQPQAEETATENAGAGEGESTEETSTEESPEGPPETYADFTLPEGAELTGDSLEKFTELAKKAGMTQELAQEFIDLSFEGFEGAVKGLAENMEAKVAEARVTKRKELQDHPELGQGYWKKTQLCTQRVIEQLGPPGLLPKLHDAVLTDDVDLIQFLMNVHGVMGEDVSVGGQAPPPAKPSAAEAMFPKSKAALEGGAT